MRVTSPFALFGCGMVLLLALASAAPGQRTPPPASPATPEDLEFFEKRVRPILADNCYSCHGGNQPLGGLRLDTTEGIRKGGKRGPVVVPGHPENSLLIRAVHRQPGLAAMPPDDSLATEKIATLAEWVRRGAPLPTVSAPKPTAGFPLAERRQHWAYQPVKRPVVPKVKNAAWARNPIDAFVLAKLEAGGLKPAPPTDRRTLIRRVTFDLTGLPPTPCRSTQAFLADKSPNAYEKVVGRLLASPRYGEYWAPSLAGCGPLRRHRKGPCLQRGLATITTPTRYRDWVIRVPQRRPALRPVHYRSRLAG